MVPRRTIVSVADSTQDRRCVWRTGAKTQEATFALGEAMAYCCCWKAIVMLGNWHTFLCSRANKFPSGRFHTRSSLCVGQDTKSNFSARRSHGPLLLLECNGHCDIRKPSIPFSGLYRLCQQSSQADKSPTGTEFVVGSSRQRSGYDKALENQDLAYDALFLH